MPITQDPGFADGNQELDAGACGAANCTGRLTGTMFSIFSGPEPIAKCDKCGEEQRVVEAVSPKRAS